MNEIKLPTEKEIHELAVSKKWWEKPRSDWNITGLISSELSEALEDYRKNKPIDDFYIEIADCVIRCKDAIQAYRDGMIYQEIEPRDTPDKIGYLQEKLVHMVNDFGNFDLALHCFIELVFETFDREEIEKAIVKKHKFNKTRPEKHGGKLC